MSDATKDLVAVAKDIGAFVARLVSGPIEQGVGIWEDKLKYLRWERQIRLAERANEFLLNRRYNAPPRPVPLNIALPIIQGASIEENDELQDRWAVLLVNAADPKCSVEIRKAYCSILEDVTPFDALILEKIYDAASGTREEELCTVDLPDVVYKAERRGEGKGRWPKREVEVSRGNLARLGLLESAVAFGGTNVLNWVHTTVLGWEFLAACKHPKEKP